jgi:hypothetical protein
MVTEFHKCFTQQTFKLCGIVLNLLVHVRSEERTLLLDVVSVMFSRWQIAQFGYYKSSISI